MSIDFFQYLTYIKLHFRVIIVNYHYSKLTSKLKCKNTFTKDEVRLKG